EKKKMAKNQKKSNGKTSQKGATAGKKNQSETLKQFGRSTSGIVQKAASVLEEEVAAGIAAAKEVEKNLREGEDFRSDQFNEIVQRLRQDAHDVVTILSERVEELRSKESDDVVKRFQKDAHDIVDTILNLVNVAPDAINRINKLLDSENTDKGSGK
ncbi:MAG TPA: hypothetical protein VK892_04705, partial [Pyrinomonadaceae bacterium]|nr:hypothetical protein [Pyrinomonadaceae bacterium]